MYEERPPEIFTGGYFDQARPCLWPGLWRFERENHRSRRIFQMTISAIWDFGMGKYNQETGDTKYNYH
jgi:hypothetical protein